ncbi:minor capsid protein L2 [Human papillomavirus 121]|uniref:Minor capsid protein L2 n=1 Tax=Human papillomavirus 121 TaxID=915429 RepID=D7P178_9PAPI|nr:minor capsid protein L2 [Human papillomavirus 121]ADH29810.1 minor capsid protein L2 [Human papillomavirus 121]
MNTSKRVKRDSVKHLYEQCKITGNCPDDVKNKVEGTTLADRLLQWLGSVIYLGGLGIGTGKGSGGSTGYTPLGRTPGVGSSGTVVRPTIPLDPLGPTDIIPIDTVDPAGPALVPLNEGNFPDVTVVDAGGATEDVTVSGPDLGSGEIAIITESDPISDVTTTGGHPTVSTTEDNVAVIDVQTEPPPPKRLAFERGPRTSTPTHISVTQSIANISDPGNIFVDAHFTGQTIGEEIPLTNLGSFAEFEIEEAASAPKHSTPKAFQRAYSKARDLYNRRVQQVQTRNVHFLNQPSRLVQFEFTNPAFEEEQISLQFQQDVQQLAAAPDPDFQDIITLGRPRFSETADNRIRVSRLGRRGTIRTRSGLQIGQQVHFYLDLSTIDNSEAIELGVLGEHTGDASIINPQAESSFIDLLSEEPIAHTEDELLDDVVEDFGNAHLILTSNTRTQSITMPTIPPGVALKVFVTDIAQPLFVSYPQTNIIPGILPTTPTSNIEPAIIIDLESASDFFIHPSLLKRKRKRPLL